MKKFISASILSLMIVTSAVAADNYSFEPVEISTPPSSSISETTTTSIPSSGTTTVDALQSESFQNALLQLDSAQVDMRDKLLEYKNQYAEINAQYLKYKKERADLNKVIKQTEKKIKNVDKYKQSIRKDMI